MQTSNLKSHKLTYNFYNFQKNVVFKISKHFQNFQNIWRLIDYSQLHIVNPFIKTFCCISFFLWNMTVGCTFFLFRVGRDYFGVIARLLLRVCGWEMNHAISGGQPGSCSLIWHDSFSSSTSTAQISQLMTGTMFHISLHESGFI